MVLKLGTYEPGIAAAGRPRRFRRPGTHCAYRVAASLATLGRLITTQHGVARMVQYWSARCGNNFSKDGRAIHAPPAWHLSYRSQTGKKVGGVVYSRYHILTCHNISTIAARHPEPP